MAILKIAMTAGEPAGIGPDLMVQIAQQPLPAAMVVIADPDLLTARAQQLRIPLQINLYDPQQAPLPHRPCHLTVLPIRMRENSEAGTLNPANAAYVLKTLTRAAEGCMQGEFAAVVTGPVHKGVINDAGIVFSGHTEFFADFANVDHVVMMLANHDMRVALATTHLPLRKVPEAITAPLLTRVLQVLHKALQENFAIHLPKIAVCGLNPHAGENGHLGREEIEVITPVLTELRRQGMQLTGPWPADTIFTHHPLSQSDAILALYHDQGLPHYSTRN